MTTHTDIVGPLGFPSKMPGTAYGISAEACITGARLAAIPGSVCHDCYALKGNYIYPSVKQSHAKRLAALADPRWVATMIQVLTITHARGRGRNGPISSGWHRWHDSGDLQSPAHLGMICDVARGTPHIRHWLPTREHGMVRDYIAQGGQVPENLTIRISATMIDGPATKQWPTTSGVHTHSQQWFSPLGDEPLVQTGRICPAPRQDGHCGPCRACWSRDVAHVTYHKH